MANICNTCKHPDVDTINKRIVDKVSVRKIVAEFPDLSNRGLQRHKDTCLQELYASVIVQKRAGLLASVDKVLNEIEGLKRDFPDNPNVRLGIVGKLLDVIEKEAKLTGAYIKDASNPADNLTIARQVVEGAVAKGFDRDEAIRRAAADYGVLETELIG